ncbi:aldolase/citrate lyase family protein [Sporomusa termitida]|uniref:Citrate lyase subunit beta n=1 Tax=Sporomusa termitida TaxID=2377 RepID=A0A517DRM9_9FIRM|nr:aldolase/citrate lyase family protein [Sporomusa termitida]QDR80009.1 Citrate lyase subunit beta [Sporomusa termitida]
MEKKLRRAMMFMPGNNPSMLQNAGIYGADTVIFDLEDAVAISEKDAARHLVHNAIKYFNYPCEVAIRINHIQTPYGVDDLKVVLAAKPDLIRLPKAESPRDIEEVDAIISEAESRYSFAPGSINMMAAVETAKGLRNAYEIATASPRMVALAIGGEDFIADLKTTRSKDGKELFVPRSQLLLAARAAGIDAIDTVFADINDEETFIAEVNLIKQLGFDGKSVINPRQVRIVHQIFTPTEKEIAQAGRVIAAYNAAIERNSGVINLDGKMIDTPMVLRAERVLAYAKSVKK